MRRIQTISLTLLLCVVLGCTDAPETIDRGRVILFSWDGAAHWTAEEVLQRAELPNLRRLVKEGAWADGMVSSFPTKTAAAHAMLWTGRYGHQNGVTANSVLLEPATEHTRLESRSGYFSENLQAEPLWTMTARAGLRTYAFHATQSYPFERATQWLPAESSETPRLLQGYTHTSHRAQTFSESSAPPRPASGWTVPEAHGAEAREIQISLGDDSWWGLFFDDPSVPSEGVDSLGLSRSKESPAFERVLRPGLQAAASEPLPVSSDGMTLYASVRLFEVDPEAQSYLVYLSSARELAASSSWFQGKDELATEAYAGNGGGWAYRSGEFGVTIPKGGSGVAEDRFLTTLSDLGDQLRAQARRVLDRRDYRLAILYSPILDDASHAWAGFLDPAMPGHDPEIAEKVWPKLVEAYRLHEGFLGDVLQAAERDGGTVLLVSDHGMAGTNRLLNLNVVLERAGLLARTADDRIDLARTRALYLPLADSSIAVNTTDRLGGIVPPAERATVLALVRATLEDVRDPDTGERLITGIYPATTNGPLQPGGATTGDLFLDLERGYYFSASLQPDEIVTVTEPSGDHIFLPTRSDMLSICGAWGNGVPSGERWPQVRSIDIAPTVLELLGLPIPEDLPGQPLLGGTRP